jgi:hypothetical protein
VWLPPSSVPAASAAEDSSRSVVALSDLAVLHPKFGVQFHGMWSDYNDTTRAAVLDQLAASGARWLRIDVAWSMIQPAGPGSYDLGWGVPFVDRVVSMAHARGFKVLVMFWMTPGWANDNRGLRAAPDDPADYARAIRWAADRWSAEVDAWEVWNEPNLDDFFAGTDPGVYSRLLCAAYPAVKAGDPSAKVVFAGVVFNDVEWIERAYAAGAHGCFDVMATHPYQGPADLSPLAPDNGEIWRLTHVPAVRQLMVANGDAHKPIWFTEFGWSSHPNTGREQPWDRGVTAEQQASYAVDALRLIRERYPYVRKAFWYNERNKGTGDAQQDDFGLLTRDLTRKPVYNALQSYLLGRP